MFSEKAKSKLQVVLTEGNKVSVFLVNGIKLQGTIDDLADDCIFLKAINSTSVQLVFYHAISTVVPESV